ncbi:hypothetical protein L873DRAFT_1792540 [Choiromyces venosus 120613-1]|uniref:Uncharacterized protein n=1 Tax=Choiromyces venosus 120613-1 TaxID=1336337 RepID=A0A3N4J9W9_9PEZI|nr:hypothetical protein L873DRAFT_1792540 [Choiromyces venosus 120613-1]
MTNSDSSFLDPEATSIPSPFVNQSLDEFMIPPTSTLTTSQGFLPLYNLQSLPVASPTPSPSEEPFSPCLTRLSSRIESVIRAIYLQIDKLEEDQRVRWEVTQLIKKLF